MAYIVNALLVVDLTFLHHSFLFTVQKAKVLYSYVAENEDELSITEGDIVTILETELEDSGWWKGELSGEVGVFPDNFVCIIPAEEVCTVFCNNY